MRNALLLTAFVLAGGALPLQSMARSPTGQVVYPAKGQSAKQADQDRYECHDWAREQSGFDPTQAPPPASSTPSGSAQPSGAMVRGAAGGAAVAELADRDAGKGAATGLLGSALRQRAQQQQTLSAEQQRAAQQQAARLQQRSTYDRGFGACMEARGYVVK
ncbi:hypothetical protein [Methylibium petroleiphilum]